MTATYPVAGGGGGAPSGPAGGVLAGTYPNPSFAADQATQAELDAAVAALTTALGLKQDASSAATDAELAAGLALKQDAATAATDTELAAEAAARAAADALLLPLTGGTLSGALTLPGNPGSNLQAAPKQYVDTAIANLINSAPGALDTLGELATQLASDESAVIALTSTVSGKLAASANLSDLANAATARTNLGLGTSAPLNVPAAGDAAAGEVAKGSDTRLTNSRTPTAHKTSHEPGGSDAMAVDAAAATGSLRTIGTGAQQAAAGAELLALVGRRAFLFRTHGRGTTAATAGVNYVPLPGVSDQFNPNIVTASFIQPFLVYLDPAKIPASIQGKVPKLRVGNTLITNTATWGTNFTFGLAPAVITAGTVCTWTAFTASKTTNTPAISPAPNADETAAFDYPAAGLYVFGYTVSGAPGGNFRIDPYLTLEYA